LLLRKISKFDVTRCHILRLKCTKFDFRWGSAHDRAGGAHSAPQDSLTVFKGAYFGTEERGKREGREREREKRGKGREGMEGEGPGPKYSRLKPHLIVFSDARITFIID